MNHEVFVLESVNVSARKGTVKHPVPAAEVQAGRGIIGDAHAGEWHRQVSLLDAEKIEAFEGAGRVLTPGEFAENLTTRGVDLDRVAVFDRMDIGQVRLEITQIGKECHSGCAVMQLSGECIMPKAGLFARVVEGGTLAPGMAGVWQPLPFKVLVVTLSDRAAAGSYEDRSGPAIEEELRAFFLKRREHLEVSRVLIPDEGEELARVLEREVLAGAEVIITCGSTGIGPRDIAPEVTARFCDKLIPGIMERIRTTFGAAKPNALLSRGVAGVKGRTLLFNVPGSIRAAREYLGEIAPLLEHMRLMVRGIDAH